MRVFSVMGRLDLSGQKSLRGRYLTNASAAHISRHSEHTDAAPRSLASDHAESTPLPLHPISAVSTSLLHRRSPCTNTHTHTHTSFAAIGTINCGVLFKLAVTVHQCLNGRAPPYLSEHCIPVSSADTRRHLRSANRQLRFRLNTYGRRAFSVAGPMAWNSLPDFIRDPTISTDCFRRPLKTYLFACY